MKSKSREVAELKNIGSTIAKRLSEIGVHTEDELRSIGAAEAHRRIRRNYPEEILPVCYYLYSLEAALEGIHWDDLPESKKQSLRGELG